MVVRALEAFRKVSTISLSAKASTEEVISSHRISEGLRRRALPSTDQSSMIASYR
jgi:hypothetical protein